MDERAFLEALDAAREAFWQKMMEKLPRASGDVCPLDSHLFDEASERIARAWVLFNPPRGEEGE